MKKRRFSWEQLNAYVDGETRPDLSAEIAAAVAVDKRIADEVALISRLRAETSAALEPDPLDVPPIRPTRRDLWKQPRVSFAHLAASIVVALVVGGLVWQALRGAESTPSWYAAGVAEYEQWAETPLDTETDPATQGATHISIGHNVGVIPDLTPARLQVTYVATRPTDSGESLFIGYVGRHGCRLGLWIGRAPESLGSDFVLLRGSDGEARATWKIGATGYAVIARNMDQERFGAIARYLEFTTRQMLSEPDTTRTAAVRDANAPCLG